MLDSLSIKRRLLYSHAFLAFFVCGLFYGVFSFAEYYYESVLLKQRMQKNLEFYVGFEDKGIDVSVAGDVKIYRMDELPSVFKRQDLHGMGELDFEGRKVGYYEGAVGDTNYLITGFTDDFEYLEDVIFDIVFTATIVVVLVTLLLIVLATNFVARPLMTLTDIIKNDGVVDTALFGSSEIKVLAQTIVDKDAKIDAILRQQEKFNSDVNHELNTPISVILGAAEILLARMSDQPELSVIVERIRRTALSAAGTVKSLLLLAQAPEKVKKVNLNLRDIVEREIQNHRYLLKGKPVFVDQSKVEDIWLITHAELAGIAIGNLIRNACQYTDDGCIWVSLDKTGLRVADSGIGVAAEFQHHAFEPFTRGVHDTVAGFGLGLSIVRRVAHFLGWRIDLQGRAEGGTVFTIYFA